MRRKPVPPTPDALDQLWNAHRAVPLIPGSENDRCGRVATRLGVTLGKGRDQLVFCQSLGLACEVSRGFERIRDDPDQGDLRRMFGKNVFGAREMLDALNDEPTPADTASEVFVPVVPNWKRRRDPEGRESCWRDGATRLLDWVMLFGMAARTSDGYVVIGYSA